MSSRDLNRLRQRRRRDSVDNERNGARQSAPQTHRQPSEPREPLDEGAPDAVDEVRV